MSRRAPIGAALVLAALLGAGATGAEVRRLEAVGAVPVKAHPEGGVAPRDAAIREALREAVFRVAHELLLDEEVGEEAPETSLEQVLGGDMVRYTSRFRILDDRGERPALFADEPDVRREYVLVVAVHVDVDRVRARLAETGLLTRAADGGDRSRLRVEVRGLTVYPAYQALRVLLIDGVEGRSVVPVELARGRAVLEVASDETPSQLADRLITTAHPNLDITLLRAVGDSMSLAVQWTPPAAEEGSNLDDGAPRVGSRGAPRPAGERPVRD